MATACRVGLLHAHGESGLTAGLGLPSGCVQSEPVVQSGLLFLPAPAADQVALIAVGLESSPYLVIASDPVLKTCLELTGLEGDRPFLDVASECSLDVCRCLGGILPLGQRLGFVFRPALCPIPQQLSGMGFGCVQLVLAGLAASALGRLQAGALNGGHMGFAEVPAALEQAVPGRIAIVLCDGLCRAQVYQCAAIGIHGRVIDIFDVLRQVREVEFFNGPNSSQLSASFLEFDVELGGWRHGVAQLAKVVRHPFQASAEGCRFSFCFAHGESQPAFSLKAEGCVRSMFSRNAGNSIEHFDSS